MKILCETQVVNRELQSRKSLRAANATLAIGFHVTSKTKENPDGHKELEIIHFTPQNKTGTRYKVRNNIEKFFTKFIKDGKATIGFKQPPENLMVKCDPIQLKAFLQALKLGLEGKQPANLNLNIASTTAIPAKSKPLHTLTICKRSDYPIKGFPKTLKKLTINDIELCKISFEICSLRNLTVLNLCNNQITKIPTELGRLSLVDLDVSHNLLSDASNWQWLRGLNLQKSLQLLDLSANQLTNFPRELFKLKNLNTLKLNNNSLRRIPFGVRCMLGLRRLHLVSNKLQSLPSSFNYNYLEMLDIWGNRFEPHIEHVDQPLSAKQIAKSANPLPLWLMAARQVSAFKIPYTTQTLPWTLVDMLDESPLCACGKLCCNEAVLERATLAMFQNIKYVTFSRDRSIYADIVLCGPKCMGLKQINA